MRSYVIPEWEKYTIYENGDVYSQKRQGGGGKLKPVLTKQGYLRVSFYDKNKKKKDFFIHRLLALGFIENPNNKPCIDHIDRNRQNNNLNNLRWATYEENNNNKEKSQGSIHINKREHDGVVYEYIRYTWIENKKRRSKNFKTMEEAEEFKKFMND
jgi:hypothetical protein